MRKSRFNEDQMIGVPPAQARLLAAGARPGLVDGPAPRPLAPRPTPCYQAEGLPS